MIMAVLGIIGFNLTSTRKPLMKNKLIGCKNENDAGCNNRSDIGYGDNICGRFPADEIRCEPHFYEF